MIRIIAGKYRSRKISTPDVISTKPTKDMTRGGIFSALAFDINNKNVLDLFAGSGALGIEAISRGAASCTFVDNNKAAIECIRNNLSTLAITNGTIMFDDYKNALSYFNKNSFDIVLLDPPYKEDIYYEIIDTLINKEIITNNAIIVLEANHEMDFAKYNFSKIKMYKYGYSLVYILRR